MKPAAGLMAVALMVSACAGTPKAGPAEQWSPPASVGPPAEVVAAVSSACRLETIPAAARYTPTGQTPARIVLVQTDGMPHRWTDEMPAEWTPASVAEVSLVACAEPDARRHQLEVCRYINGPDITRFDNRLSIRLMAPHTGALIAEQDAVAAAPRLCEREEPVGIVTLDGAELVVDDVLSLLGPYVEWRPEECQPPATRISLGGPITSTVEADPPNLPNSYFCLSLPPAGVDRLAIEVVADDVQLYVGYGSVESAGADARWKAQRGDGVSRVRIEAPEPGNYYIRVSGDLGALFTLTITP